MLFVKEKVKVETLNEVTNFFKQYDTEPEIKSEDIANSDSDLETPAYKYITTLVTSQYQKSVEDIANTKIGNRRIRKRNLQQIMQESFFAGANRFGNNFIA